MSPAHRHTLGPTGDTRSAARVRQRVAALLAKAESTTFAPEAEALTAKAQDLLARHALDAALGANASGGGPEVRTIAVPGTYAAGRAMLLGSVARANRASVVWDPQALVAMAVGFPEDLDATEVLWRSLLTQAEHALTAAGPQRDARGRSRTRSFRSAFWASFAQRIGQRLADQQRRTVADVAAGDPGCGLLPVLASRQRDVDAAMAEHFPRVTTRRTRVSSGEGWSAGRAAAERARLGATPGVGPAR